MPSILAQVSISVYFAHLYRKKYFHNKKMSKKTTMSYFGLLTVEHNSITMTHVEMQSTPVQNVSVTLRRINIKPSDSASREESAGVSPLFVASESLGRLL